MIISEAPSAWKRVKAKKTWAEDPGSLESPRVSFGVGLTGVDWVHEVVAKGFEGQTTPLAWMNQINTLYDTPLEMEYDNLDTSAVIHSEDSLYRSFPFKYEAYGRWSDNS